MAADPESYYQAKRRKTRSRADYLNDVPVEVQEKEE